MGFKQRPETLIYGHIRVLSIFFQVSGLFMRPFQGVSGPYAYDRPLRFCRSQSCRGMPHADLRFRFGASSLASWRAASTTALDVYSEEDLQDLTASVARLYASHSVMQLLVPEAALHHGCPQVADDRTGP